MSPVTEGTTTDTTSVLPSYGQRPHTLPLPDTFDGSFEELHQRVAWLEQLITSPRIMSIDDNGKLTIPDGDDPPDPNDPGPIIDIHPPADITGLVVFPGAYYENIFADVVWDQANITDVYMVELATAHIDPAPPHALIIDDLVDVQTARSANIRFNNLIPNTGYVVRITPISKIGVRGNVTDWVYFDSISDTTIPVQITDVWIGQGTGAAVVKFTDSPDADVGRGHGLYEVEIDKVDTFDSADFAAMRTTSTIVSFDIPTDRDNWYARVRAIDSSGNEGPWSDVAGPSVAGSVIDDMVVSGLNAAKITFGTMSGDRITANTLDIVTIKSSTITTASITIDGGNIKVGNPPTTGMIITSQGLRLYDGGVQTITLDAPSGQAFFQGEVNASTIIASIIEGSTFDGGTTQNGTLEAMTMNASEINATNIYGSFIAAGSAFVWDTGFIDNPSGLAMQINELDSYDLGRGIHWTEIGDGYGDTLNVLYTIDCYSDADSNTHFSMGTTSSDAGAAASMQIVGGEILFVSSSTDDLFAFFTSTTEAINFGVAGIGTTGPPGGTAAQVSLIADVIAMTSTSGTSVSGNLAVTGSFTAGSKSFVIDHPVKSGMLLEHATLEGPEHGVYYRGTAKLQGGEVTVQLPAYFEKLTLSRDRTVQLTPVMHSAASSAVLAASVPKQGKFDIVSSDPKDQREVFWCVQATRSGVTIEVERPKDPEQETQIAANIADHHERLSRKAKRRPVSGKGKKLQVVTNPPPDITTPDKEHSDAVRSVAGRRSRRNPRIAPTS